MRWLAAAALVFALAPAVAEARPHAAILFLPWSGSDRALLDRLARDHMAIGFSSPTVGGFEVRQMALDMSQGARIPTRLYARPLPSLQLLRWFHGWELHGWRDARIRARDAPADVVPGLLGTTIERAGMRVVYVGTAGQPTWGAIVAADEARGCCPAHRALIGQDSGLGGYLAHLVWPRAALLVADLPRGREGPRALDALVRARRPGDVVYVVQAPRAGRLRLLPSGVAGAGGGELRSATTRLTGLVAATDVAPTVLHALGLRVPDKMDGEPIEPRGRADPAGLVRFGDRLTVVASRRGIVLAWLGGALVALLALLSLFGGVPGARLTLRIAALAALWAPGVMLATAAAAPGRTTEAIAVAGGSLALGLVTELALPWPFAPALPAAVVFAAHAVDLARGSPLIARSLAGPNPLGGARFYGIGNELETILSVSVLAGVGAAVAWLVARRPAPPDPDSAGFHPDWEPELARDPVRRSAPAVIGLAALVAAAVMGAGRLGADVGAVITLAVGGAAAVLAALGGRPSRRALALAVAAPVVAVGALIVVDLVTHGGAHLTRSVLHHHGSGGVGEILKRRVRAAYSPLGHSGKAAVFAVAVGIVALLAYSSRRLLAPLAAVAGGSYARAGLIGAFFAVIAGMLANDSGPLMLEIGAVLLVVLAGYAACPPSRDA